VRVGAHPEVPGRDRGQHVVTWPSVLVEELLRAVGAHPLLELAQVLRVLGELGERDLV
jgi:hypothetical protein